MGIQRRPAGEERVGCRRSIGQRAPATAEFKAQVAELTQALCHFRVFSIEKTLNEQLADAVASEQYELAARLRDQMSQRGS